MTASFCKAMSWIGLLLKPYRTCSSFSALAYSINQSIKCFIPLCEYRSTHFKMALHIYKAHANRLPFYLSFMVTVCSSLVIIYSVNCEKNLLNEQSVQ